MPFCGVATLQKQQAKLSAIVYHAIKCSPLRAVGRPVTGAATFEAPAVPAAAAAAAPAAVPAKKRGRRAPSASWGGAERRSLETLNDLEAGAELLQLLSRGGEMTGGGQAAQASLVHSPLFTFSSRGGQGEALCLLIHAERSLPLARSRAFHVGWQGESPAPPYARGGAYVFSLHALAVRGLL